MTRSDALFEAARRWDERATHDRWLVLLRGPGLPVIHRRRLNALGYKLWCHRHAVRCRVLALRAVRDAARQDRLAAYCADQRSRSQRHACRLCAAPGFYRGYLVCHNTIQRPEGA